MSYCVVGLRMFNVSNFGSRGQLTCDGTRAETRFSLSAKRASPFKSAGASIQWTTGSRCMRISSSNAGYTMFRGSVKGTGYPLHSPFPLHFPSLRHRAPSHFNSSLPLSSGFRLYTENYGTTNIQNVEHS